MPLAFKGFEDQWVPDLDPQQGTLQEKESCGRHVGREPTSVLDTRSPSPSTFSSTMSSSQGSASGGGYGDTTTAAASADTISATFPVKGWQQIMQVEDWELLPHMAQRHMTLPYPINNGVCSDLETAEQVLDFDICAMANAGIISDDGGGSSCDFSVLLPHNAAAPSEEGFSWNQFVAGPSTNSEISLAPYLFEQETCYNEQPPEFEAQIKVHEEEEEEEDDSLMKLPQNPTFFFPLSQQLQQFTAGCPFQNQVFSDELINQQMYQATLNWICQAAELIEARKPIFAQGILARLNHQLSLPIGKPYQRACFHFKEALQLLATTGSCLVSPVNLVFKLFAHRSLSSISPIFQFSSFSCNQILLEAFSAFDRISVLDFGFFGYGEQWASLMQELALQKRNVASTPSLHITTFASPKEDADLVFARENLKIFAEEINIAFEFEILSLECFNSGSWNKLLPFQPGEKGTVAVNLSTGLFSDCSLSIPPLLAFLKQLSPRIIVWSDNGHPSTHLSTFSQCITHGVHYVSSLIESLDAAEANPEAVEKIERLLIRPGIEKLVMHHYNFPYRAPPWTTLFSQAGFSPLSLSSFTMSQAEYLVQRAPATGFSAEMVESSLVLRWQQKVLVSISAWKC